MSKLGNVDSQLDTWRGKFGVDYTKRNMATPEQLMSRRGLWAKILETLTDRPPGRILEVGANVGNNLRTLSELSSAELFALEPNPTARAILVSDEVVREENVFDGSASDIPLEDGAVDLVFTSGVLIHIHPDNLMAACAELNRVSSRYLVCIEYFSARPEEVSYQERSGLLFKRDFGEFYLDNFPELRVLNYGFEWKRATGLDNLTWWIFSKGG